MLERAAVLARGHSLGGISLCIAVPPSRVGAASSAVASLRGHLSCGVPWISHRTGFGGEALGRGLRKFCVRAAGLRVQRLTLDTASDLGLHRCSGALRRPACHSSSVCGWNPLARGMGRRLSQTSHSRTSWMGAAVAMVSDVRAARSGHTVPRNPSEAKLKTSVWGAGRRLMRTCAPTCALTTTCCSRTRPSASESHAHAYTHTNREWDPVAWCHCHIWLDGSFRMPGFGGQAAISMH